MSLFALTTLVAITMSIAWKKVVPKQNQLLVQIDGDWKTYDVQHAIYGIHMEGNVYFLTVACSASSNANIDPPDCSLEFSIPFENDPTPKLKNNSKFSLPVYDDLNGNLNYFLYLGFGDISDGVFTIQKLNESTIDGTLTFDGNTVLLRADFQDTGIGRSFD